MEDIRPHIEPEIFLHELSQVVSELDGILHFSAIGTEWLQLASVNQQASCGLATTALRRGYGYSAETGRATGFQCSKDRTSMLPSHRAALCPSSPCISEQTWRSFWKPLCRFPLAHGLLPDEIVLQGALATRPESKTWHGTPVAAAGARSARLGVLLSVLRVAGWILIADGVEGHSGVGQGGHRLQRQVKVELAFQASSQQMLSPHQLVSQLAPRQQVVSNDDIRWRVQQRGRQLCVTILETVKLEHKWSSWSVLGIITARLLLFHSNGLGKRDSGTILSLLRKTSRVKPSRVQAAAVTAVSEPG